MIILPLQQSSCYLVVPQLDHVLQAHWGGVLWAWDHGCVLANRAILVAGSLTNRRWVMSTLTLISPAKWIMEHPDTSCTLLPVDKMFYIRLSSSSQILIPNQVRDRCRCSRQMGVASIDTVPQLIVVVDDSSNLLMKFCEKNILKVGVLRSSE